MENKMLYLEPGNWLLSVAFEYSFFPSTFTSSLYAVSFLLFCFTLSNVSCRHSRSNRVWSLPFTLCVLNLLTIKQSMNNSNYTFGLPSRFLSFFGILGKLALLQWANVIPLVLRHYCSNLLLILLRTLLI